MILFLSRLQGIVKKQKNIKTKVKDNSVLQCLPFCGVMRSYRDQKQKKY